MSSLVHFCRIQYLKCNYVTIILNYYLQPNRFISMYNKIIKLYTNIIINYTQLYNTLINAFSIYIQLKHVYLFFNFIHNIMCVVVVNSNKQFEKIQIINMKRTVLLILLSSIGKFSEIDNVLVNLFIICIVESSCFSYLRHLRTRRT